MTRKRKWMIVCGAILLLGILCWIWWGNTALEINEYVVGSTRVPQSFSGFRIAQISDLHNAQFGEGNSKLLDMLAQAKPDVIVITGDLIDSRRTDIPVALNFCKAAMHIAPVYYVTGNHEARVSAYAEMKTALSDSGVTVLDDERIVLSREGGSITLIGVDDPSFRANSLFGDSESVIQNTLSELQSDADGYTILLSHRPELFDVYADAEIDLVFSGHAHGGQFRLPFAGGLFAPGQGFFPEYDAGLFRQGNTAMIVSRGLGNSLFPFRFNNPPEIIVAELKYNPV